MLFIPPVRLFRILIERTSLKLCEFECKSNRINDTMRTKKNIIEHGIDKDIFIKELFT